MILARFTQVKYNNRRPFHPFFQMLLEIHVLSECEYIQRKIHMHTHTYTHRDRDRNSEKLE